MKRNNPARLVLLVFLLALAAHAQQSSAQPDLTGKFTEYMEAQERINRFTGAVLVAREGKVLFARGYGMANLEHGIANTPQTKFRLGSITKQFTAVAFLQLQEKGKLSVQDPVCKYVPDCPAAWAPITIHHLLTHTSGIPNFTSFPDYQQTMMLASPPEKTLVRFRDKPLDFAPGERFSYSNSGYVLLGFILEKVAGQSYEQYLRQHILGPAGMRDTGYDVTATVLPGRASGYSRRGQSGYANAAYMDMTIPHAAGALYSTVEDFVKWDQALSGETLLKQASLDAMFTPAKDNYAYGWVVRDVAGRKTIGHGGGINGFNTAFMRYPTEKLIAVAFSNVEGTRVGPIASDLAAITLGLPYELPKERIAITVDPKILDTYVGRYELAPTFSITVMREGDGLMTQATGQSKVPIYAESETKFFLRVVDAQLTFVKGPDGKVTHLILHQGGRDQQAKKVE
jgi:CubicO group peptidase (beta-lactamase class C family)